MEFAESLRLAAARGDLAAMLERAAAIHVTREMCSTWPAVYKLLRSFSPAAPVYLRQNTFGWDIAWCAAKQAALFYEELRVNYVCPDAAPTYLGAVSSDLSALIHLQLVSVKTSGNEHTLQIFGVPLVDGDIPCTLIQENSSDKYMLSSRKIVCDVDMNTPKYLFRIHRASMKLCGTPTLLNYIRILQKILKHLCAALRATALHFLAQLHMCSWQRRACRHLFTFLR